MEVVLKLRNLIIQFLPVEKMTQLLPVLRDELPGVTYYYQNAK